MPELNLSQAARLYGKSRMTLHRHCGSGRVTSRLSDDGQRLIDLSELIRAYGEPPNRVTLDTPSDQSQRDDLLLRELQDLREQVTQLREEVRELRRLPASKQPQEDHAGMPSAETEPPRTGSRVDGFGDLLRRFEAKH